MKCFIEGIEVDISKVGVDAHGFGQVPHCVRTLHFSLEVEFDEAIKAFFEYYKDFIEREKEDEGFEEVLTGDYLKLSLTGYLDLDSMLLKQPTLLASVLRNCLPTEFMGYLFHVTPQQNMEKNTFCRRSKAWQLEKGKSIARGALSSCPLC